MKIEVQDFGKAIELSEVGETLKATPIRRLVVTRDPTKIELTSLPEAFYTAKEESGAIHLRRTPRLGAYRDDWEDEEDAGSYPEGHFDAMFDNITIKPGEGIFLLTYRDPADQKTMCAYVRVPEEEDKDICIPFPSPSEELAPV